MMTIKKSKFSCELEEMTLSMINCRLKELIIFMITQTREKANIEKKILRYLLNKNTTVSFKAFLLS